MRVVISPPRTPPYLLLLFYAVNMLSGFADLTAIILGSDLEPGSIVLNVLRATVPTALLWVAGTFPVEDVLPCPNVAGANDVSPVSCCSLACREHCMLIMFILY